MDASPTGIGHRIYEVRRALGPDARHELPQRAFADLLNEQAVRLVSAEEDRTRYDSSVIARLEKGDRRATVQDITVVAAIDPKRRGKLWLGWGEHVDSALAAARHGPSVIQENPDEIFDEPTVPERKPAKKKRA